jgi:hypothetical protein
MKKFPALKMFIQSQDFWALVLIKLASNSFEMIGGTAPPSSGFPPLKASFVKDVIVSLVLKIDGALIAILTAPVPVD